MEYLMSEFLLGILLGSACATFVFSLAALYQAVNYQRYISDAALLVITQLSAIGYFIFLVERYVDQSNWTNMALLSSVLFATCMFLKPIRLKGLNLAYLLVSMGSTPRKRESGE